MCTVDDNDYEESVQCIEEKASKLLIGTLCKKCQDNKAEVVLRIKDTYCRHCFMDSFTHKFRATLGKSKIMKPHDRVIVSLSGSASSVALLQLVKDGIEITTPKRLQCHPLILYIDEGAVLSHSPEERLRVRNSIARIVKEYNIPGYVTTLDKCFMENKSGEKLCSSLHEGMMFEINDKSEGRLEILFNQLKSGSSKEDLLLKLRHKLLFAVAQELECSKIFVADCTTDLAVTIMSNLALGRGAQLSYDVGFCDSRHSKIHILRPMRDFSKKEIAFFNVFRNVESVHYSTMSTKVDSFSSIQKLTEKFIVELQNSFPSTVSTVFRTGNKLTGERAEEGKVEVCILCESPLGRKGLSRQATVPSHLVPCSNLESFSRDSEELSTVTCHSTERCDVKNFCSCTSEKVSQNLSYDAIKEWLCYGCRIIVKEMDSPQALPNNIIDFVKTEINRKQLRKQIEDFLL